MNQHPTTTHQHKKTTRNLTEGFTLVEVIVSIGLFTVVATTAIGALLAITNASHEAQNTRAVVDNIGYVLEDFSRTAQMGTAYACEQYSGQDCTSLSITGKDGHPIIYSLGTDEDTNFGIIQKSTNGSDAVTVSPSGVDVKKLTFVIADPNVTTGVQPRVRVVLQATIGGGGKNANTIHLQTTVTQRPKSS